VTSALRQTGLQLRRRTLLRRRGAELRLTSVPDVYSRRWIHLCDICETDGEAGGAQGRCTSTVYQASMRTATTRTTAWSGPSGLTAQT